ncbi:leucine-rich repeat-containing protein 71 isoform X2 [Austrofundulus limnaeus]|uniref:Leucine-rich repeat-containing protein 71 isoform X2 n=1 Tax=Austrofundulus limnaeus TaxID=52670 RepID=A0A2I4BLL6_AUSLI|nr:PREDICTED: leucine-rich repeat-containing protein 71 isoform X2 [Austrofundulus limnaeus]
MIKKKQTKEKTKQEDQPSKILGLTTNEAIPAQTFDEYQCTGNVKVDFPVLGALLNIKNIPLICSKQPDVCTTATEEDPGNNKSQINASPHWSTPCINVELENEDPLSTKKMTISGWKVNEQIFRAIQKMLPSMGQLLSLQFWQAGLTDQMLISLTNTASLCSGLRSVTLEGNALPEQSFHLLLSEGSVLTHLSLRNNRIGVEGARLIGSALSTSTTANKNLLSLNLAFNSIGDAGAAHIARGLRLNRTLLFLSLANNQIGDSGAAPLAEILGKFPLTHEEVVERRKLLLQRISVSSFRADLEQLSTSQFGSTHSMSVSKGDNKGTSKKKLQEASGKDVKTPEMKEKIHKKAHDVKPAQKGGKLGGKDHQSVTQEDKSSSSLRCNIVRSDSINDGCGLVLNMQSESVEAGNPLLDQSVHHKNGQLFLPGNTTLASLNLAGNRITEKSLPLFLAALETQEAEERRLLRLCLQRNLFPAECEDYMKIKDIMSLTNALFKTGSDVME